MLGIRSRQSYCNSFNGYSPAVYFPFFPRIFVCVFSSLVLSLPGGGVVIHLFIYCHGAQRNAIRINFVFIASPPISVHICVCVYINRCAINPYHTNYINVARFIASFPFRCVHTYICLNTKLRFMYVAEVMQLQGGEGEGICESIRILTDNSRQRWH